MSGVRMVSRLSATGADLVNLRRATVPLMILGGETQGGIVLGERASHRRQAGGAGGALPDPPGDGAELLEHVRVLLLALERDD